MDMYDEIEITNEDFMPLLVWCMHKFQLDPQSRISIGGRADKIGGFIDRFSNTCANWIIFNHLLRQKNFKVESDLFFYDAKKAKKCADVIGLLGDNKKRVPLTTFHKDKWVHHDNAPFIEVKTLRKEGQYCAGLGMPQYDDNHYFVYVESDFDELYLLNFFKEIEKDFTNMDMSTDYIKDNSEGIIKSPPVKAPENKNIGSLRLLGIYKGTELIKHNIEFLPEENLRYIRNIKKFKKDDLKETDIQSSQKLCKGRVLYSSNNAKKQEHLPIYTNSSSIKMRYGGRGLLKTHVYIEVIEECYLNEYNLSPGFYDIEFAVFDRKSSESELWNHKSAYDQQYQHDGSHPTDCTDELILKLEELFNEE